MNDGVEHGRLRYQTLARSHHFASLPSILCICASDDDLTAEGGDFRINPVGRESLAVAKLMQL